MPPRPRAGVVVVRAWVEGTDELRARITYSTNVENSEVTRSSVASRREILDTVRAWLTELCSGSQEYRGAETNGRRGDA